MKLFTKPEDRPMVCDCGSTDISTQMDIGSDIDPGGEERQHMDTCRACGMKRFWVERWDDFTDYKVGVGVWKKTDWEAAL